MDTNITVAHMGHNTSATHPDERPTILILAYSDLSKDPRVSRQIGWLSHDYHVIAAGTAPPNDKDITFLNLGRILSSKRGLFGVFRSAIARIPFARTAYRTLKGTVIELKKFACKVYGNTFNTSGRSAREHQMPSQSDKHIGYFKNKLDLITDYSVLEGLKPDLIIANDLDGLVLADSIFNGEKILFDAHEYAPLEYEEGYDWLNFEKPARIYFCKELLPKVARMTTVCQGIADEYMRQFAVRYPIEVITNSPLYENITPGRTSGKIRIIHHGVGAPIRKIELMAEAVKLLDDRFELYLMLVAGDPEYIKQLELRYAKEPRIHFINPVPMLEIAKFTSQFDIGLFLLEPTVFNYKYALPNKFFEFIQARLAIAIGPSLEMERIVKQYDLGVVAADFSPEAMANALRDISIADIDRFRSNSHQVAAQFCAEANKDKMLNIVRSALSDTGLPVSVNNLGR